MVIHNDQFPINVQSIEDFHQALIKDGEILFLAESIGGDGKQCAAIRSGYGHILPPDAKSPLTRTAERPKAAVAGPALDQERSSQRSVPLSPGSHWRSSSCQMFIAPLQRASTRAARTTMQAPSRIEQTSGGVPSRHYSAQWSGIWEAFGTCPLRAFLGWLR